MNTLMRFVRYWLPAVICMTIIFILSSRQRVVLSDEVTVNFVAFKILHMIEYGVLYFLLFRGFYSLKNKDLTFQERLLIPFILAILYGASDEFHQTLVPTREGHPRDVLIDSVGILFAYMFVKKYFHFVKKFI